MKQPYDYSDKTTVIRHETIAGAKYARMRDGSLRRIEPERPYRGKAERRSVIKARRDAKAHPRMLKAA